jgi:citrate synthase
MACLLLSVQFVNAQTAQENKEELEAVLEMCKYILSTPADTTDVSRDMSMLTIGMWMLSNEDFEFATDSASARIMAADLEVSKVYMAAMVEYQIKKKEKVFNNKVRLAVAKRTAKYIDNPANKVDVSKSKTLQELVRTEKGGMLEGYLEWLEKQKS